MPFVVRQLQILWCEKMVRLLFLELIDYVDYAKDIECQKNSSPNKSLYIIIPAHTNVCMEKGLAFPIKNGF